MSIEIKGFGDWVNTMVASKKGDMKARNVLHKTILGQNYTTDADGGYCMPSFIVEEIFSKYINGYLYNKARKVNSPSRLCNVSVVKESGRTLSVGVGGLFGYWVGEGEDKTKSKLQFDQLALELNKLVVLNYITDELLQDVPQYEQLFMEEAGMEMVNKIERAMIYGAAGTSMAGIMDSAGVVEVALTTPTAAELRNVVTAMAPESFANACWYMGSAMYKSILSQDDENFSAAELNITSDEVTPFGYLLSRPIYVLDCMDSLDLILIDPTEYLVVQGNKKYDMSGDVLFTSDQTVLKLQVQLNGCTLWQAPRTQRDGTSVSAFVIRSAASGESSSSSSSSSEYYSESSSSSSTSMQHSSSSSSSSSEGYSSSSSSSSSSKND